MPRFHRRPPGLDGDGAGAPVLPDAEALAAVDAEQLTAPTDEDHPPVLPVGLRLAPTPWTVLEGSDDVPF